MPDVRVSSLRLLGASIVLLQPCLQRSAGRLEGQRRELLRCEEISVLSVVRCLEGSSRDATAVDNDDIGAAGVFTSGDNPDDIPDLGAQPGFLKTLAAGGLLRRFSIVDEACRQTPESPVGIHSATHEQDTILAIRDQNCRRNFVLVKDNLIADAAIAPQVSKGEFVLKRSPALSAIVQCRILAFDVL